MSSLHITGQWLHVVCNCDVLIASAHHVLRASTDNAAAVDCCLHRCLCCMTPIHDRLLAMCIRAMGFRYVNAYAACPADLAAQCSGIHVSVVLLSGEAARYLLPC